MDSSCADDEDCLVICDRGMLVHEHKSCDGPHKYTLFDRCIRKYSILLDPKGYADAQIYSCFTHVSRISGPKDEHVDFNTPKDAISYGGFSLWTFAAMFNGLTHSLDHIVFVAN